MTVIEYGEKDLPTTIRHNYGAGCYNKVKNKLLINW